MRSAFSELMVKPWYLQMCLDFPELGEDHKFNNAIGIRYNNDNVFEEMKQNEIEAKRIAAFTAKKGIVKDDGTPYFATEYLVRTDLKMTEDEIEANQKWFDFKENEEAAAAAGGGGAPVGGGGGGGAAAGAAAAAEGGSETIEGGETKGAGQL